MSANYLKPLGAVLLPCPTYTKKTKTSPFKKKIKGKGYGYRILDRERIWDGTRYLTDLTLIETYAPEAP